LLTDQDEMNKLYRGNAIDASYQVSVHLAERFRRRIFFFKSANQKQELPVVAMFVNGSGRNEQSLSRTLGSIYGRSSMKSGNFVPIR
jgi:hypothetical protein